MFHVVCHDCPFEEILDDSTDAADTRDRHTDEFLSHDVEFAEVA